MARHAIDFSGLAVAAGLPAGFATEGAAAAYEVVAKVGAPGGQALRVAGSATDATRTLWTAQAGALQYGEIYARVTGGGFGIAANVAGFKYTLLTVSAGGVSVLRVDPDNPNGAMDYPVSDDNRYSGPNTYEFVFRVDAGRIRAAMWRPADVGMPWDTWLYDLEDTNPNAPPAGAWGVQTVGNADIEFIGIGTDGDDAPRATTTLKAPRRPEAAVTTSEGVATLDAGAYASPVGTGRIATRYRVAISDADDHGGVRYLFDEGAVVLDTGWVNEEEPYAWTGASPSEDYALEVTFQDFAAQESAPGMLVWFNTGRTIGRSEEGLTGFDLFGHRPAECSDGIPEPDSGGLRGGLSVVGLPEGYGVIIERAGGVLYPTVENPFQSGEVPSAAQADATGEASLALPADAVALRVYSRRRRAQGNAATQHLVLDAYRDLVGTYVPEHGLQPGDVYTWAVQDPPAMGAPVVASVVNGLVRLESGGYAGDRLHTASRWRVHETHASCPRLVFDSGWVADLYALELGVDQIGAPGWPTVITVTHQDERGIEGPASVPTPYVIPWALPTSPRRGVRQREADFAGPAVTLDGATLGGRPDAIAEDYLTAFTVGPRRRSDPSAGLLDRVWKVEQLNAAGGANLYRADDSGIGYVFSVQVATAADVVEVDLAFDQNGAPAVCAERPGAGGPEVWLHWYNPAQAATIFEKIGNGRTPRIVMDTPETPETAELVVFYINDTQDRICYRRQSENFAVENLSPVTGVAEVSLEDVALLASRRLQVFGAVRDPATGTYALGFLETTLYPYHTTDAMTVGSNLVSGYMRDVEILYYPEERFAALVSVMDGSLRENVVDLSATSNPRTSGEQWATSALPVAANLLPAGADAEVSTSSAAVYHLGTSTTTVSLSSLGLQVGSVVSASLEVRSDLGTTVGMQMLLTFHDASGTQVGATVNSTIANNVAEWTFVFISQQAVPLGATHIRLRSSRGALGAGDTYRRRNAMFNFGAVSRFVLPGAVLHTLANVLVDLSTTTNPRIGAESMGANATVIGGEMVQIVVDYPARLPEQMAAGVTLVSGVLENA